MHQFHLTANPQASEAALRALLAAVGYSLHTLTPPRDAVSDRAASLYMQEFLFFLLSLLLLCFLHLVLFSSSSSTLPD